MKRDEILVIGVALLDLPLGPVDEGIFHRETTQLPQIRLVPGGDALNQATVLARLGQRPVLLAHIGDDRLGRLIQYHCWQEQIDDSALRVEKGAETRINVVLVRPDGQRTFLKNTTATSAPFRPSGSGQAGAATLGDSHPAAPLAAGGALTTPAGTGTPVAPMIAGAPLSIDPDRFRRAAAVSLASLFSSKLRDAALVTEVLAAAKAGGALTFADTVPPTAPPAAVAGSGSAATPIAAPGTSPGGSSLPAGGYLSEMAPYLPTIDYLLPNQEEAALLTGESDPETAAARFLEAGLGTYAAGRLPDHPAARHLPAGGPAGTGAVVIKLGADGCLICTRSRTIHVPGFLARTVDTTGAGDTFVAAFLSRILAGDDLESAGRFANRLAARSTEYMGATPKEIW